MKETSSKKYFECHITLEPKYVVPATKICRKYRFKTSLLLGDDLLGGSKYLYLTTHDKIFVCIHDRMDRCISDLAQAKIPIIRKKIEQIVLDVRYT